MFTYKTVGTTLKAFFQWSLFRAFRRFLRRLMA